jgi:hypothetical protein
MHVDLIEPTDRRWLETLAATPHDFYHLPEYASLESSRLGGTAVAAYVEQPGVRLLLSVIGRAILGRNAFDLVSRTDIPAPSERSRTSHYCEGIVLGGSNAA